MGCDRILLHDGICAMIKGSELSLSTVLGVLESVKATMLDETISFSGEDKRQKIIVGKYESFDDIKRSFFEKYHKGYW